MHRRECRNERLERLKRRRTEAGSSKRARTGSRRTCDRSFGNRSCRRIPYLAIDFVKRRRSARRTGRNNRVETTVAIDASLTSTTVVIETTTSVAGPVTEGASVIVANANGVSGSAGLLSDQLSAAGYSVGSPTNASSSIGGRLELTVVYYDAGIPAAQAVAESVAVSMGGVSSIAPVQTPAPTQTGSLDGAGVLVMLGLDKAGRTLEELVPAAVTEIEAGTSG